MMLNVEAKHQHAKPFVSSRFLLFRPLFDYQRNPTDLLLIGVRNLFEDGDNYPLDKVVRFAVLGVLARWLFPYARQ